MRKPYYSHNDITLFHGNALDVLAEMEPESVHCCVTSPPYFNLRDYGCEGQIGLEDTPDEFIAKLVEVFRQVKRVLRDDGTLWVNIGDSYNNGLNANRQGEDKIRWSTLQGGKSTQSNSRRAGSTSCKPKDLLGIPWMLVFALRADGWWLRSEITWCKKAPMPESVTDRPTCATEKLFLFAKSPKYFYDHVAVRQPSVSDHPSGNGYKQEARLSYRDKNGVRGSDKPWQPTAMRNLWNYWLLGPEPSSIPHFATFPTKLVEPCILAGSSEKGACPKCGAPWQRVVEREAMRIARSERRETMGDFGRTQSSGTMLEPPRVETVGWQPTCKCPPYDPIPCTVLDPFCGVGTTGIVSIRHRRKFVGIDLKREYLDLAVENMDGRPIRLPLEVS